VPYLLIKKWVLVTGFVFLFSSLAIVLFDQAAMTIVEPLMNPWLAICRALTPIGWQTLGNIPLAMMWLFSGLFVYSMIIGAVAIFLSSITKKVLHKNST
jgi:hypothetical protein